MNPILTISIATRNRCELLKNLLDLILKSKTDWRGIIEVDIVVDGTDDYETIMMLEGYPSEFLRWFVIPNGGLSKARNFGAEIARGKFIRLQDDDDELTIDSIFEMLNEHAYDSTAIILGKTIIQNRNNLLMRYLTEKSGILFNYNQIDDKESLDFHDFWGGRVSLPTQYLRDVPFDSNLVFGAEDIDWAYRFSNRQSLNLLYRPKVLSVMRRDLSIEQVINRSVSQGWANFYIESINQSNPLGRWAKENCGLFINAKIENLVDEIVYLRTNPLYDEVYRENLARIIPTHRVKNIESFLEAIWWRIVYVSKAIGYQANKMGLAQDQAILLCQNRDSAIN